MRHGASLIAAIEGISRPAFRIARELVQNSRSGLTLRFLSKKLDLPEEEIEYLIDVNDRLFFFDLTRVRLVAEGGAAVHRISAGLENHGDIPSLFRAIRSLDSHDFRRLEEQIGIASPSTKNTAAEALLEQCYQRPDSVVEYVATRGFSKTARELFDVVWQTKTGIVPVSVVRAAHGGTEYDVEQGLWELFQGFVLFELFRFDAEERLIRAAALLAEVRQARDERISQRSSRVRLKAPKKSPDRVVSRGLDFSDRVCRIVAAVAARPARLRADGDLFREDRRRLSAICAEDDEPSLAACLWAAQGVGWLARVDNELRTGDLGALIHSDRLTRHRILFDWLTSRPNELDARRALCLLLEELKANTWYMTTEFIQWAMRANAAHEQPVLRNAGGHWRYVNPSLSAHFERNLARSLEETLLWLGVVDRAEYEGESAFRLTDLGRQLLSGEEMPGLKEAFPERKAELIVQPNFDIVVPIQDVDPLLTVPLDQFTMPMSAGRVAVYRLTKESFTRAVQEGHEGDAFVEFLVAHNRGGALPANVRTTLDDWRGGIKRVRLRTLHVLESDDPLVMADLANRRKFKRYLTPIDSKKTVMYEKIAKTELAKELERDGFIVE